MLGLSWLARLVCWSTCSYGGLTGLAADHQSVLDTAQIEAYESVAWQGGDQANNVKTSILQYTGHPL